MANRKMEINIKVEGRTYSPDKVGFHTEELLEKLLGIEESLMLMDAERSLIDIEHDLAADCQCDECRAFERLRNSLNDNIE